MMRNVPLLQLFLTNHLPASPALAHTFLLCISRTVQWERAEQRESLGSSAEPCTVCRRRERRQVCKPTRHSRLGFDLLCLVTPSSASFLCLSREDVLRAFTWPAARNRILAIPEFRTSVLICLALGAALLQNLLLVCAMNLSHQEHRGEFDGVRKHDSPCGSPDILDHM